MSSGKTVHLAVCLLLIIDVICGVRLQNGRINGIVQMHVPVEQDRGVVQDCGKTGYPFNIYWEPKKLNPGGKVTFHYNVTVPSDFAQGPGTVAVYLPGIPQPIVSLTQNIDCAFIKKYTSLLPCPLKKGTVIQGSYTVDDLSQLKGFEGDYTAKAFLKNDKGQMIGCGILNATVV